MSRTLTPFPYEKVLVLGLAKSGTATANLLLKNGIHTIVNDFKTEETDPVVVELRAKGAEVIVGSHPLSVLENIDLIVKNPGIPYENVLIKEAIKRDIPIITEVELAGRLAAPNPIIGVTGSNGKTTTTTLIDAMLTASNKKVKLAGNIGFVASEMAETLDEEEPLLLELSSFQLMGIDTFKPHIAVMLNLFEAHLDYHGDVLSYERAKFNMVKNQTENDYFIYNADDARVVSYINNMKAICIPFSVNKVVENGAYVKDEALYFKQEKIIDIEEIVLVGSHNISNILAAIVASKLSGATNEGIIQTLTTFSGVEHRLQFVGKIQDRLFYNDSKATNKLATEMALQSFQRPTILLAGGLDRGDDYDDLIPFLANVKGVVLFGETKLKLKEMAEKANIEHIAIVENVKEAVPVAFSMSNEKDVILLSPACASWDQYKTFEERGNMFVQAVHTLA
ncbi:MAG TPA: UDP-N-acetylmuramoyl-L-alanine--D-glutamate ligase [Candidatus Pseudogracilibacillus intestinigallinarum]|uniref:UDP-N-acetylmuramoylalanine--D-glutamate ligase n=1 Tax=Candidatus Pseudogracilibacillus intestinigallinarum TaxID=2838742 RepID=A0A9D1PMN4_9BACI|nr:UDP-N-acetylmuramoyl-L-alanine--D-glutamate ligase [Candidatus Pseudogracilibacillus intestinigallinarum]